MSLTGLKKHVRVLGEANLVSTEKVGRARVCRLGGYIERKKGGRG